MVHYPAGAGDIDLYTQAGEKLLSSVNPYLNSEYANSPLAAVFVYWLSILFPVSFFPTIIQGLNAIGILSFGNYLLRFARNQKVYLLAMVGLSLSTPLRALIADVQVTGIVLGLFTTAFLLYEKHSKALNVCAYFLICLSIELKPQLALPLALVFWIKNWDKINFYLASILFLLGHALISVHYGRVVELLWLDKLSKFSNKSFLPGPEISIWKFANHLAHQEHLIKWFSTILLICFFVVLIRTRKTEAQDLILLASVAPLINSYSHMYDLVPLILLIVLNEKFAPTSVYFSCVILIIPGGIDVRLLLASVLVLHLLMLIFSRWNGTSIASISSVYALGVLFLAREFSAGDIELELSARLVGLIPLMLLWFKRARFSIQKARNF
jgi:hypothetical protein